MKSLVLIPVLLLSACSWFHKKPVPPDPTQLVVTGAPAGSFLLIDQAQVGQEKESADRPQVADVTPGMHVVEIKVGDGIVYRENAYVAPREKHVIVVLSGNRRN